MIRFQYEQLHAGPKQQLLGHRQFFISAICAAESRYKDSKYINIKTIKPSNLCTATLRAPAEKMTMCILPMN